MTQWQTEGVPSTLRILRVDEIIPNPWNANEMDAATFEKEKASIAEYGFIDPVTVRTHPWETGRWQIIDGEHRWRCAAELGFIDIPCVVLDVDDDTAQELGIVLNELRGKPNSQKLKALVAGLVERQGEDREQRLLPFDRAKFLEMMDRPREIDFSQLGKQREVNSERWVERIYRMPAEAAAVVDEAIEKVRSQEDVEPWRALELIAADYMA